MQPILLESSLLSAFFVVSCFGGSLLQRPPEFSWRVPRQSLHPKTAFLLDVAHTVEATHSLHPYRLFHLCALQQLLRKRALPQCGSMPLPGLPCRYNGLPTLLRLLSREDTAPVLFHGMPANAAPEKKKRGAGGWKQCYQTIIFS